MTEWVHKKLGECCTIHGRIGFRGYTTDDLVEKGYGAITFSPSDIHDFKLCYDDCDYISWKKYEESPEIKVFNGDILFCKTASIGKCAFVEDLKEKATINPQFVVLKDFQCDSKFLYYKLISFEFQTQVQGITGGSTIKTMSQEKLGLEDICIPYSTSAQRRIAAILSSADKMIASTQKVIAKYKQMKQGLMEDLLKPKEGWKMVKLGEVGEINPNNKESIPNQFVYIDLESVVAGKLLSENHVLKKDAPSRAQRLVFNNDVLYQTVRPYQKNNYIHKKVGSYVASTGYALIRCNAGYNPDYVYYMLHIHSFESIVMGLCTGTSYPAIAPNNLKRIEIAVPFKNNKPDLAEQRRIAAILSGIDAKIAAEEKVLEKYTQIKKGLMEKLLNE